VGAPSESIGDSGCVLAQRPGMDVMASSLGGRGRDDFKVRRRRGAGPRVFRAGESGSAWARAGSGTGAGASPGVNEVFVKRVSAMPQMLRWVSGCRRPRGAGDPPIAQGQLAGERQTGVVAIVVPARGAGASLHLSTRAARGAARADRSSSSPASQRFRRFCRCYFLEK
jgi:hypothetical protein